MPANCSGYGGDAIASYSLQSQLYYYFTASTVYPSAFSNSITPRLPGK